MHYLDNSATTKVSERAANKVYELMVGNFGNPSSLHTLGIRAEDELNSARSSIADALAVNEDEVYFTSGGTEANNLAVLGTAEWLGKRGNKIVTTAVEHSSVMESMAQLEKKGFEVVYIKPDRDGRFSPAMFSDAIDEKTILVSVMSVNNEIGTILPTDKLRRIIDKNNSPAILHSDCVQAFGKIPVKPKKSGIDIATVSGHKIHAPKGVGAIYLRKGLHTKPLHFGGEQEKRFRPGTEALPLIAGFAEAVRELCMAESYSRVKSLNDYARQRLTALEDVVINSPDDALPYIINFSLKGIRSETALHFLAQREVYVSSGSACAKGKPSHVLEAMGLERKTADSALRVSFARDNTEQDVDALIEGLKEASEILVKR